MAEDTVRVYRFKQTRKGQPVGKESLTELPLSTWNHFREKSKDGSRFVDADAANWRIAPKGDKNLVIETEKEVSEAELMKDIGEAEPTGKPDPKKEEFNKAIIAGEEAMVKEDYTAALAAYEAAAKIYPAESYPKKQISKIKSLIK